MLLSADLGAVVSRLPVPLPFLLSFAIDFEVDGLLPWRKGSHRRRETIR